MLKCQTDGKKSRPQSLLHRTEAFQILWWPSFAWPELQSCGKRSRVDPARSLKRCYEFSESPYNNWLESSMYSPDDAPKSTQFSNLILVSSLLPIFVQEPLYPPAFLCASRLMPSVTKIMGMRHLHKQKAQRSNAAQSGSGAQASRASGSCRPRRASGSTPERLGISSLQTGKRGNRQAKVSTGQRCCYLA